MSNVEYANATDEQLEAWAWAAYQDEQEAAYNESVSCWYKARGYWNMY